MDDLVLTNGYIAKLLSNARVVRYLARHQQDILTEFERLTDTSCEPIIKPVVFGRSEQFSISVVPGPIEGAGLSGLMFASGKLAEIILA